jgi:glycosyltransferase involved in cell wall biosynthesis
MRILEVLTYYRPHISGLTIYVERLSRSLARQGHEVTVLTSRFDRVLPRRELLDGVKVERVPVAFRVSKGVIMPTFGPLAWKMARGADIIHLHLPQFDAPGVALRGRLFGKPVVLTYHCDLQLPDGLFNRAVDAVVHGMNRLAGFLADAVVTYTFDYAQNSPFLARYIGRKLHVIPPPVEIAPCSPATAARFRQQQNLNGCLTVGISARVAAEKGIEVLLNALPEVIKAHPNVQVLHANPQTLGEEAYAAMLEPLIERNKGHYRRLGALHGEELSAFYQNLDCLVVPSLNATESFGLVQVEAMMNGTPVIASDLPGVRQPVTMTGMGEVTAIGDAAALAASLNRVLRNKSAYIRPADAIGQSFDPDTTAAAYLQLFHRLQRGDRRATLAEPAAYTRLRRLHG